MRDDNGLQMEGQDYLQKKNRASVKITTVNNIKWDFGSGDYKDMVDQQKAIK